MRLITIPVHHKLEDANVRFVKIPRVGWDLNAFWHCEICSEPYMVGHSNIEQDINLISLYQLKVNYSYKDKLNHIDIVTDGAKRPDGYKFSISDVTKLTLEALLLDFPDKGRYVFYLDGIKQKGAEQPTTTPEPKLEGNSKSQFKSEERSQ